MPLGREQERLALIIFAAGGGKVLLAGGAGLVVQGLVDRPTDDLDGFIDAREDFLEIAKAAEAAIIAAGYEMARDPKSLGNDDSEIRSWIVRRTRETNRGRKPQAVKVQFVRDHIALPPAQSRVGLTVDPVELGANKILAIYDRLRARDFDDLSLISRRLNLDALLKVADAKQVTPLDRGLLAGQFRRIALIPDEEFHEKRADVSISALRSWAEHVADVIERGESLSNVDPPPVSAQVFGAAEQGRRRSGQFDFKAVDEQPGGTATLR